MKIRSAEIILAHRSDQDGILSWNPCWVRLLTDEGIDGIGEIGLAYGIASSSGPGAAKDLINAFVLDSDPFDIESIWEKMYRGSFWGEGGGPVMSGAISAIDAALWDIKGKALGMPVWKLLGGKTNENLRTYASCLVPECDGVSMCHHRQEGLWGRYFTDAPRPRTLSERQYSDRRLRSRS